MLEYEVTNRAGLIAAVRAAAQATFEAAKANPVHITWGRCTYRFAEGIHATRAEKLAQKISRMWGAT